MTMVASSLIVDPYRITEAQLEGLARATGASLPSAGAAMFGFSTAGTGVGTLALLRESGLGQYQAMGSLHEGVLTSLLHERGAAELLADGLGPLLRPQDFPGVIDLELPEGKACLWARGETWVLMILSSAAVDDVDLNGQPVSKSEEGVSNAASALIMQVLDLLRPRTCRVGGFDRVVRAFKNSSDLFLSFKKNVGWLEFGFVSMFMSDSSASQQWQQYTLQATASHQAVVEKTTEGRLSAVRSGLYPFGGASVPPGFVRVKRRLALCRTDVEAVRVVVAGFAGADPVASDIARELVALGLPRRRSGEEGVRFVDGVGVPVAEEADFRRGLRWVRRFEELLPDLVMGKLVLSLQQPRSLDQIYLGFRPVYRGTRLFHQLVWDVPDLFVGSDGGLLVEAEVLDRAVAYAVGRRVEAGLVPSDWLEELRARDEVSKFLVGNRDPRDPVFGLVSRWARHDGSMVEMLAPGRHPRADHFKALILGSAAGVAPRRRVPSQSRNGYLSGLPMWVDESGMECWLDSQNGHYRLCVREPDLSLSGLESRLRARDGRSAKGKEQTVAIVERLALHRSIVGGVVSAIDEGVLVISGGFDFGVAGSADDVAGEGGGVSLTGEIASLRSRLGVVTEEARVLLKAQMLLQGGGRDEAVGESAGAFELKMVLAAESVNEALGEVEVLQRELDAHEAMAVLDAENPVAAEADLEDMELLVDLLATVHQEKHGSRQAIRTFQRLISSFRAELVDGFMAWEIVLDIGLPNGGVQTVGPIRGRLMTTGRGVTGQDWSFLYALHLCTRSLDVTPLLEGGDTREKGGPKSKTGHQKVLDRAAEYLASKVGPVVASAAVSCPSLEIRKVIWNLAHRDEPDKVVACTIPDVTAEYLALMEDTYLSGRVGREYHDVRVPRQPFLDEVIGAGGEIEIGVLAELVMPAKAALSVRVRNLRGMLNLDGKRRPRLSLVVAVREDSSNPRSRVLGYRARLCPHCRDAGVERFLDLALWVAEVPTGLLCSGCMREPSTNSVRYPDLYRGVAAQLGGPEQPVKRSSRRTSAVA